MSTQARRPTAVRTEGLVTVSEPVEGAFTLLMPEGWTNQIHLQREHGLNRIVGSSIRPDQGAMLHLGDPRIPLFMAPSPYLDPQLMAFQPHVRIQPYTPADRFFADYVGQCFGAAPGFRMTAVEPSPGFHRIAATVQARDPGAEVTAAAVAFEHAGQGRALRCRLLGSTTRVQMGWLVDHVIISTVDDPAELEPTALRVMTSRYFRPDWVAAQQSLHQHRMAMGAQQDQHIRNMTNLQAQGHQQRMQDIENFGQANRRMHEERMAQSDASHQSWMNQQAQNHDAWMTQQRRDDATQQSRINAVNEENTVVDSSGATYQVDIHHERYYVNKRDNTYIGADAVVEQQDLRRTHGVNPDDYEEVRIVR